MGFKGSGVNINGHSSLEELKDVKLQSIMASLKPCCAIQLKTVTYLCAKQLCANLVLSPLYALMLVLMPLQTWVKVLMG